MTAAAVRAGVLPLSGADNSLYVMQYDMQAPAVVQCFSTNCYMLPFYLFFTLYESVCLLKES